MSGIPSGQPMTSFTCMPNWLIDDMPNWSGNGTKLVLAIARKTLGWSKASDRLSFSQLMDLTGLNRTPLATAIREMIARGVIERHEVKNSYAYGITDASRINTDSVRPKQSRKQTDANAEQSRSKTENSPDSGHTKERKKEISEEITETVITEPDAFASDDAIRQLRTSAQTGQPEPAVVAQPTLDRMPGTPTPSFAAPPSPPADAKPKRKPKAPADVQALYEPLFNLTGTPRRTKAAIALYTCARDLRADYQAELEEFADFDYWFRTHSSIAVLAARDRRPVNPPAIRQVTALWGQYVIWRDAKLSAAARMAPHVLPPPVYTPPPPVPQGDSPEFEYDEDGIPLLVTVAQRKAYLAQAYARRWQEQVVS